MNGKLLKNYLKAQGVKLTELAAMTGITPASLNDRFNTEPKMSFIREIAEKTGISIKNLMAAAENNPSGMVNEDEEPYQTTGKPDLKKQLQKIFKENTALHQTIADRNTLIIELLEK